LSPRRIRHSPSTAWQRRHNSVAKLYYMAWRASTWSAYQAAFRQLVSIVDLVERQARSRRISTR